MDKFLISKKLPWTFAIVALAAILVMVVITVINRNNNGVQSGDFTVRQTDIATNKLPDKFPSNIPLEQGATVSQNYNLTTNDGRFQATRTFESKKSLEENMKIYTDFAGANGWNLGTAIDQQKLKVVSATKDNLNLAVTISQSSGINTVNITVTEQVGAAQ